MQALGKLQDPRGADVLAEKLADPALRVQAVHALRLMGPGAEGAVLEHVFDDDADTRLRANQLLAEYGTRPKAIADEALGRLKSNRPDAQRTAAVWFAENPPDDERQQAEVARALTGLLDDLSPKVNSLALRALNLWATRDCLPQLVAFARRNEKAGACPPELIDVLARFPDETAAEAVALHLKTTSTRGRAVKALLKLGPVATKAVLAYLDYPDAAVQKEARGLCQQLLIPTALQLEQTLADVADPRKPRARAALQSLARLRPEEASRAKVSPALNAPLLDPDPAVVADALNAVRVWGSKENTATLLKVLAKFRTGGAAWDPLVIELLGSLRDPTAAPALAEGLNRPQEADPVIRALIALGPGAEEAVVPYLQSKIRGARVGACWVLGAIGTSKSLEPLEAAGAQGAGDREFYQQTRIAAEKIQARK
jgi:HEAT repeat protein